MIWLYRILYLPALLLVLPYYGFRMWRRGGYGKDFRHRLGFFHRLEAPKAGKIRIWLQAVSVGEVLAIGPLIDALTGDDRIEIVLTTTTSTGYVEALKRHQQQTRCIGLFPLDFWPCTRLALGRIQPHVALLTESELWPEFLHQTHVKGITTFLINARISEKSFKRYRIVAFLAKRLLRKFDFIYTNNDLNKSRLLRLGAEPENIQATGNIKFDVAVRKNSDPTFRSDLLKELGFKPLSGRPNPFVLLGSSTWPGEEQTLLNVQAKLIEKGIDCRLLLVPRHAERGDEIAGLLEKQSLSWHQRSTKKQAPETVQIYLADTTGELTHLTQIADLAFIGKSLPPNMGGQTPIEAAGLGVPILMGPNMSNFREITRSLLRNGAARTADNEIELKSHIEELANQPELRTSMAKAGMIWHKRNRGSSQRIAESILSKL